LCCIIATNNAKAKDMTTEQNKSEQDLQKAIFEGDINKSKKLLEAGASMPTIYEKRNSDSLKVLITKPKRARSIIQAGNDSNYAKLDESTAEKMSNTLGAVNEFDNALQNALDGGFIVRTTIDVETKQSEIVEKKERTDMLKKRWKLAATVLNHFASHDNEKVDFLERFNSLKEIASKKNEKQQEWGEVSKLINRYVNLAIEQQTDIGKSLDSEKTAFSPSNHTVRFSETTNSPPVKQIAFDKKTDMSELSPLSQDISSGSLNAPDTQSKSDEMQKRGKELLKGLADMFGDPPTSSHTDKINKSSTDANKGRY
jgi:hypothetical protein